MSNTTTARTSRPGRDKPNKSQIQNGKDGPVGKNPANKPTPEQMRTAQLVDRKPEDTEYNKKVSQIMELTKKSEEEVIVALYDCDQDTNRTVNLLLEGGGDQGEWQEMGKKRKKNTSQPVQNKVEINDRSDRKSNKENAGEKGDEREPYERGEQRDRSESSGRNRRIMNDGPPRFQKAGKVWRGSQENNDRSGRGDRGGNFERGRGRGRGRSGSRGGRGGSFSGGFGGGGFRNNSEPIDDWGDSGEPKTNGFESSPPIDTWTNDQAAKKQNSWGETEDWNDDDWTGPLTETTVFTARNLTPSTPGKDQNDQKPDTDDGFIQSNSLPQPIDLSAILNQRPSEKMDLHAQSNQATESLKSMMGIGTSAPSNYSSVTSMPLTSGSDSSSSLAVGTMSQSMLNQTSMPLQSQRAKPMRSKLPPPSKIPNTPVEMPGSAMSMRLDVQFGFGADPGGLNDVDKSIANSFANSSVGPMSSLSRNGPSADGNSVPSLSSMVQPKAPPSMSGIDSATPQRQSMFQNSPDTTPSKDYQHQAHLNKALMTPPDSYSNQDRQSSPRIPAHSQSNMDNDPKYSQNSYSSYQRFQPKVGVESDSSKSSYSKPQSQYQSGFQPSNSFQNQSTSNYSKLGQFSQTSSSSYRGQSGSLDHQQDTSPPGYSSGQAGSAYAQKQAQNNSYQSGKLTSYTQPSLSGQPTSTYSSKSSSDDYSKPQSSSSTPYSATQNYSGQSSTRQSDESFSSNQSASSSYNSGSQTTSNYHSSTGTGFESAAVSASSLSTGQTQTSSQSVQYGARTSAYGGSSSSSSTLQTSPISANKLSDGLSKMTVDDTASLKSGASFSDADVSTTSSSLTSQPSAATSSTSSSQLGLSSAAVSSTSSLHSTTSTSTRASSNLSASKAPPNLPPGVPTVMGPNFIVGQPGMQYFNLQGLQQPQVYSYEELQMIQQRLLPGYYDPNTALPFQQTPTSLAGARADQNSIVSNMPQYSTQSSDQKMNRVDAPSPVQGSQSGQQQQPPQSAHQQQFINAALAPSYGYYAYPNAGILPGAPYSYQPTMFQQMPPVTNTAHAPSSSSSQYQKPYSSHAYGGYDDMNQGQDFGKSGGYHMSQGSTKVTGNTGMKTITTSSSDLGNLSYGKSHSQGYDKGYHHGSTPPPYGIPAGSQQTNPMAAQTGYAPFLPMMSHQHAGQMMAHPHVQVRQDQTGLRPGAQPASAGAKPASAMNKYANTYWNAA